MAERSGYVLASTRELSTAGKLGDTKEGMKGYDWAEMTGSYLVERKEN
jgi:hypothetical protein